MNIVNDVAAYILKESDNTNQTKLIKLINKQMWEIRNYLGTDV